MEGPCAPPHKDGTRVTLIWHELVSESQGIVYHREDIAHVV